MIDEKLDEVLNSIAFENVLTDNNDEFGLHRISSSKGCIEFVRINKGKRYLPHIHDHTDAKFIIVKGEGLMLLNGKDISYKVGDTFKVPKGTSHGFEVKVDTIFLSIQSNPILNKATGEIDIRY